MKIFFFWGSFWENRGVIEMEIIWRINRFLFYRWETLIRIIPNIKTPKSFHSSVSQRICHTMSINLMSGRLKKMQKGLQMNRGKKEGKIEELKRKYKIVSRIQKVEKQEEMKINLIWFSTKFQSKKDRKRKQKLRPNK